MTLRCVFLGHKWKIIGVQSIRVIDTNSESDMPTDYYTNFLYKCTKCEDVKVKKVEGTYGDDDDDERGGGNAPVLSPDDYFDKIGSGNN